MGGDEHDTTKGESEPTGGGSIAEATMVSSRGPEGSGGPRSEDTLASQKRAKHAPQSTDPSSLAHAMDRMDARLEQIELRIATVEQVMNAMRSPTLGRGGGSGGQVAIRAVIAVLVLLVLFLLIWNFLVK